jgi:hypothetical protein
MLNIVTWLNNNTKGIDVISPVYRIKLVVLLMACSFFTVSAVPKQDNTLKKDEVWKCVRWAWADQESRRNVVCLDWRKEDCANRLHKEICKGSKQ